jgi:malonyl-CoA/methylmalonyl-CoA synthetase
VAIVVLRPTAAQPTEQALIDHVSKLLAKHKRPRVVHFLSELPRNAMGKVLKPKLRTLLT